MSLTRNVLHVRVPTAIIAPWALWVILVLILSLFQPGSQDLLEVIDSMAVLLHMTGTATVLLSTMRLRTALILISGLMVRVAVLFWDLKFRHVFTLIHSGSDSEGFFKTSIMISEDLSLLTEPVYGGLYTKAYGILFHFAGPLRAFAQYTNVLLVITAFVVIYRLLTRDSKLAEGTIDSVLAFVVFLPNALIISSLFVRESAIVLFVAVSLTIFLKWVLYGGLLRLLISGLVGVLAMALHSGIIALLLGYLVVATIFDRETRKFRVGTHSIGYLGLLLPGIIVIVVFFPDVFLGKFDRYESTEELFAAASNAQGGAAYLSSLTIGGFGDLALYGPLKGFYFLGAPMPWDFRGLADLLTFALDSLFYCGATILTVTRLKSVCRNRNVAIILLIVLMFMVLLFGAGINNAGTAVRHRFKLIPIFTILVALVRDPRRANSNMEIGNGGRYAPANSA